MQARRSQSSTSMYHDTYLQKLSNLVKVNKSTYRRPYSPCTRSHSNLHSKEQKREKPLPTSQHFVRDDNMENNSVEEKVNVKPTSVQNNNQLDEDNSNKYKCAGVLNRISRSTSFSSQHSDAIAFHYYNERRRHRMHLKQMRANKYINNVSSSNSESNMWNDKYKGMYDMYGGRNANQNKAYDNTLSKKTNNYKINHVLHTEIRAIKRQKQKEDASRENALCNNDKPKDHAEVSLQELPRRMSRHEQFMLYKVVNTNANASYPDVNAPIDVNSAPADNSSNNNNNNNNNSNINNINCNYSVNTNDPLFMREGVFAAMPESDRYVCLLMANLLLRCNRLKSQEILESLMRCVERKRLLRHYICTYNSHSAKYVDNVHNDSIENASNINHDNNINHNSFNSNSNNNNKSVKRVAAMCEGSEAEISNLYSLNSPCAIAGRESLIRVLQSKQRERKSLPLTSERESQRKHEQIEQSELWEGVQLTNLDNNANAQSNVYAHVNAQEPSEQTKRAPKEMETQTKNLKETGLEAENEYEYSASQLQTQMSEKTKLKTSQEVKECQQLVKHIYRHNNNANNFVNDVAKSDIYNMYNSVMETNNEDADGSGWANEGIISENQESVHNNDDYNTDERNNIKTTLLLNKPSTEHDEEEQSTKQLNKWKDTQRPRPLSEDDITNAMNNKQELQVWWSEEEYEEEESSVTSLSSSSSSSSSLLRQPEIHEVEQVNTPFIFHPTPEKLVELDERELSPGAAAARQAYLQAHPELLLPPSSFHVHAAQNDECKHEEPEPEEEEEEQEETILEEIEHQEESICESDDFQRPQRRYGSIIEQRGRLGSSEPKNELVENCNDSNREQESVNSDKYNKNDISSEPCDCIGDRVNASSNLENNDNDVSNCNDDDVCSNHLSFSSNANSQSNDNNSSSPLQSDLEDETNEETLSQREQYEYTLPAAHSVHIPFVESCDEDDKTDSDNDKDSDSNRELTSNNTSLREEKSMSECQVNVEGRDEIITDAEEEDTLLP